MKKSETDVLCSNERQGRIANNWRESADDTKLRKDDAVPPHVHKLCVFVLKRDVLDFRGVTGVGARNSKRYPHPFSTPTNKNLNTPEKNLGRQELQRTRVDGQKPRQKNALSPPNASGTLCVQKCG